MRSWESKKNANFSCKMKRKTYQGPREHTDPIARSQGLDESLSVSLSSLFVLVVVIIIIVVIAVIVIILVVLVVVVILDVAAALRVTRDTSLCIFLSLVIDEPALLAAVFLVIPPFNYMLTRLRHSHEVVLKGPCLLNVFPWFFFFFFFFFFYMIPFFGSFAFALAFATIAVAGDELVASRIEKVSFKSGWIGILR